MDKILKEEGGDLKIAIGDLLPPKSSHTEFDDASLTDNLTASSNSSEVVPNHLDKRQILFVQAGFQVALASSAAEALNARRKCTLGFAIRKDDRHRGSVIDHGFLMLGSCLGNNQAGYHIGVYYLRPTADPDRPEAIRLGSVSRLTFVPGLGLDYALLNLAPNTGQRIL